MSPAKVFLVGAGPGDPQLLTLKAHELIKQADSIFFDSLVGKDVLDFAREDCETIFVGKRVGQLSFTQSEINELLYDHALRKKIVLRLKGGDPFIFGRGGEELSFLRDHGIEVEVVPGITTAVAASARLQLPLTHREFGQSVIFLSGYQKDSKDSLPDYDWEFLATSSLTIVFYMGLKQLEKICQKLISHGKSVKTGAVVIANCSLPTEQTVAATLSDIARKAREAKIAFPAIFLVSDIVQNLGTHTQDTAADDTTYFSTPKPWVPQPSRLVLLLFHGAEKLQDSDLMEEIVTSMTERLKHPRIEYCFLSPKFAPTLPQKIEAIANRAQNSDENDAQAITHIDIFPIFILPGKHLDEDIPMVVAGFVDKYPQFKLTLQPAPDFLTEILPTVSRLAARFLSKGPP